MRRRLAWILAFAAVVGATAVWLGTWRPLESYRVASVPALAAPLRTKAEHDALYGPAPFVVEAARQSGGGRALVLGIQHTNDAQDPQIAELRRRYASFEPTLVLVEGRTGWHFGSGSGLLANFGESGEARALAHAAGTPCFSLEPEQADEVADAVGEFGRAKTLAFYTLRVVLSERDNGAWPTDDIDGEAEALLLKRGRRTGLGDAIADLGAFDRFWREHGVGGVDWRELPQRALWRTGGEQWTNAIAERINAFRDRRFVAAIVAAVAAGERVLAVCGSSHAILFEPALRAALAR